jgi:hypothetical protein
VLEEYGIQHCSLCDGRDEHHWPTRCGQGRHVHFGRRRKEGLHHRTEVRQGRAEGGIMQLERTAPRVKYMTIFLSQDMSAGTLPALVKRCCSDDHQQITHRIAPVDVSSKGKEQVDHRDVTDSAGDKQRCGSVVTLCDICGQVSW